MPEPPPSRLTAEAFAAWLKTLRNDLQAPAEVLAPSVAEALALLRRTPGVIFATMSGSGATCVGLTRDMAGARTASRTIQIARPRWWVVPAPMLTADPGRLLAPTPRAAP